MRKSITVITIILILLLSMSVFAVPGNGKGLAKKLEADDFQNITDSLASNQTNEFYEKFVTFNNLNKKLKIANSKNQDYKIEFAQPNITCTYDYCFYEVLLNNTKKANTCYDLDDTYFVISDGPQSLLNYTFDLNWNIPKEIDGNTVLDSSCMTEFNDSNFCSYVNATPVGQYANYLNTGEYCSNDEQVYLTGSFNVEPGTSGKFDIYFKVNNKYYYIDPTWESNNTNFYEGTYNGTRLHNGQIIRNTYPVNDPVVSEPFLDTTGLVIYYNMDQASGNLQNEVTGSNVSTTTGITYGELGPNNDSFYYDNTPSYTYENNLDMPQGAENWTMMYWVKPEVSGTHYAVSMGGGGNYGDFSPWIDANGKVGVTLTGLGSRNLAPLYSARYGDWNHIVHTYNGSLIKTWVNGYNAEIYDKTATMALNGQFFYTGKRAIATNYAPGTNVDEVYLFNRTLSPTEIEDYWDYQSHGYYESKVYDAGSTVNWTNMTFETNGNYRLSPNNYDDSQFNILGVDMTNNAYLGHFDDSSGFHDFSINDANITVLDSPTYTADGIVNGAYEFDGVNDAITIPYNEYTNFTDHMSFNFFIYHNTLTVQTLISQGRYDSGWEFRAQGSVEYELYFDNGTSYELWETGIPANSLAWSMITVTYDGTLPTDNWKFFKNGELLSTYNYTGGINSDGRNITIGKQNIGSLWTNGIFDEPAIWNDTLTQQEILNILERYNGRLNITTKSCDDSSCSGESYNNTFTLNGDIQEQDNQYFQWRANFEAPFRFNFTNMLEQVDVNYEQIYPDYTDIKNLLINVPENIFDTSTYFNVSITNFNLTTPDMVYFLGSLNAEKFSKQQTSTVYVKYIFNGETILDEAVTSVSGSSGGIRCSGTPLVNKTGQVGQNELIVQIREEGNGAVNVSHFNVFAFTDQSANGGDVTIYKDTQNFVHNSPTFDNVVNFTAKATQNGTLWTQIQHTLQATGADTVQCYYQNTLSSPQYIRSLSSSSDIGNTGSNFWSDAYISSDEDVLLYCKNTDGETITSSATFMSINMADSLGSLIQGFQATNSSTNISNYINLTAGTHEIAKVTNYEVKSGQQLGSALAAYGEADTTVLGTIFVNISNSTWSNTSGIHYRTFDGTNDIGTIKHLALLPVVPGNFYNISFMFTVDGTLRLYDESFSGLEVELLNESGQNVPPTIFITEPENNEEIRSSYNFTWILSDLNEDTLWTNLTVSNNSNSYLLASYVDQSNTTYLFDSTNFSDGYYNFTVTACENNTADGFCTNSSNTFIVNNSGPGLTIDRPLANESVYGMSPSIQWTVDTDYDYETNVTFGNLTHNLTNYLNLNSTVNSISLNWSAYPDGEYILYFRVREVNGSERYFTDATRNFNIATPVLTNYLLKAEMIQIINYGSIATFIICAGLLIFMLFSGAEFRYHELIRSFATVAVLFSVMMFIGVQVIPILVA